MSAEDLDDVMAIEVKSFPQPWTRELLERELTNPVSFPFVKKATFRGSELLAGYIVFWVVYGEGHILNIATAPELKRLGIAGSLLSFALDFMAERGVVTVSLEVRRSNTPAISLYESFGFIETYVRKLYYGDEDAVVMSLRLRGSGPWGPGFDDPGFDSEDETEPA